MAKRRIILVLVVCLSLTAFTVQTVSRTSSSNQTAKPSDAERLRNMTEEERKREAVKRREQSKLEREQRRKETQKIVAERRKGFLYEKYALRPTEEQWKVIKPKLEKVRHLRDLERSTVNLFLTSSSVSGTSSRDSRSANVPTWQWNISWKDKAPAELAEAQKIANTLMDLVDNKYTQAEEFKRKMGALRKSRSKEKPEEKKKKEELSKAQQELREVLTTRQEAALVLKKWL
jgi:hypothetical protein